MPNIHRSTQYSASRRRSKNVTFDVLKLLHTVIPRDAMLQRARPYMPWPCLCLSVQNVHLSRVGVLLKWLKGSSCFLTWRFFPPVVYHKCKKNVFLRFLQILVTFFYVFKCFFYFPNVFYLKNAGKVQSGKQINKKHFQNNSNEIQWVHKITEYCIQ